MAAPQTTPVQVPDVETVPAADRPWITVVHDDPVNLMTYVTWVFQKLFGYSHERAEQLMLDVHHKGKAVVSSGVRERMEHDASCLHGYGLWATVEQPQIVSMFRRHGRHCVATFAVDEVRVLRKVAAEVVGLLTDGFDRDDPVVSRLFPDIYPEDRDSSAEFRLYTEGDLKTGKIDQAGAILAALPSNGGGEVRLDPEAAEAWLRALNDARLAMGTRLDISAETDLGEELDDAVLRDPTSTRVFQLSVYAYLGYLQESLLNAMVE